MTELQPTNYPSSSLDSPNSCSHKWAKAAASPFSSRLMQEDETDDCSATCDDMTCDCSSLALSSVPSIGPKAFLPLSTVNVFRWIEHGWEELAGTGGDSRGSRGQLEDATPPSPPRICRASSPGSNSTLTSSPSMDQDESDGLDDPHIVPTSPTSALDTCLIEGKSSRGSLQQTPISRFHLQILFPQDGDSSDDVDEDDEPLPLHACPSLLEMDDLSMAMEWSDNEEGEDEEPEDPVGLSFLEASAEANAAGGVALGGKNGGALS